MFRNRFQLLASLVSASALGGCSSDGPGNDPAATGGSLTETSTSTGVGGSGNVTTGAVADAMGASVTTAGSLGGAATTTGGSTTVGTTGSAGLGGVGGSPGTTSSTSSDAGGAASVGGMASMGGAAGAGGVTGVGGDEGSVGGTGGAGGGAGGTSNACPTATPLTGGDQYCSNSKGNAGGGYGYELWADGSGSGCMTVYGVDANFGATWNGVEDFLARVGLDFNQTQTHTQVGTISAEFAETKMDDGGLTYIGIYGWTVDPLREFYILDDWGGTKPAGTSSDGTPRDFVGTLTADGETYDVWKKLRENKPAITGDSETFEQYFSIRQTARQCGTISVSEHFAQWEGLGLPLGNLHEVKLLVESQDNSGSIEFTTATVVVN